ncbi:MAG TPA: DASS family sodium-coupled anion symporter [Vicinamibacterales bacterium]|nr:DASS family sodium-coupled anion symporter [Vicinamibacterales bacterium]
MMRSARSAHNAAGLAAAILLPAVILLIPTPAALSPPAWRVVALFAAALVLWVSEAVPVAITALLVVVAQPLLGVSDVTAAFTSFISPVFFFVLVMFVIAQAFTVTGLDRRFALWLLAQAGDDPRRIVYALMLGCGALSTIVSDVPVCAIFMTLALGVFERLRIVPGESRFARGVMLGIPIASLIGGVGTPAGSSVNILGLFFIQQNADVRVSFLQWLAIGIPMVAILLPAAAWVVIKVHPPELIGAGHARGIEAEREQAGAITIEEVKVLVIMSAIVLLWLLGSWYPQIDTVIVAVLGAVVMFLPGVGIFRSWKDVERAIGWDALLMIGGVTSLGAVSAKTGFAKWLVDVSLSGIHDWQPWAAVAAITAFTAAIHLVLPVNPVITAVLVPPIVLLAKASGHHPALYGLPVVFTASCAFLLPLDAVTLVTYTHGYYRMPDLFVPGLVISAIWVLAMTGLLVVLGPMVGLF